MGRTQSGGLGGSSFPCLGTGSSSPCSGTLSQRLLSPVFGTSPLPTLLPPGEQVGGSAPQPPPRCFIFLSLFLMARGTLGAKTKNYNLPSFAPPTLQKREPPRSQVFRIRAPIGSCASAGQPRPWSHGHRACVGAPPPQTSPKGEERFLGVPGAFQVGIGQGNQAPNFE